jgi:hypothetical protein
MDKRKTAARIKAKAEAPLNVYMLEVHEPPILSMEVPDTMPPILYATRELAEAAAEEYNAEFQDPEPAEVVEIEVRTKAAA